MTDSNPHRGVSLYILGLSWALFACGDAPQQDGSEAARAADSEAPAVQEALDPMVRVVVDGDTLLTDAIILQRHFSELSREDQSDQPLAVWLMVDADQRLIDSWTGYRPRGESWREEATDSIREHTASEPAIRNVGYSPYAVRDSTGPLFETEIVWVRVAAES